MAPSSSYQVALSTGTQKNGSGVRGQEGTQNMSTEMYSSGRNSSWQVRNRDTPALPRRSAEENYENQLLMIASVQHQVMEGRRLLYMRCPQTCNLGQSSYFGCAASISAIQLRHPGTRHPVTALVMLLEGTGPRPPCSRWPESSPFWSCTEKFLHPNLLLRREHGQGKGSVWPGCFYASAVLLGQNSPSRP